ncbi:MFS transporter [Leifsonia aquatica]|uniref:MFS transporter n=1 Tax=Leifsonia aquatica TaxID=144185 RepID=UPI00384C2485
MTDSRTPETHHAGLMSSVSEPLAPFAVPNFRRFVFGQSISLIGSWVDTVAQALLVLHLSGSGLLLGLVTAARYLPVLLLTPYAGVIIDRADKRRLLVFTASSLAVLARALGVLAATGLVSLGWVFAIALGFGILTALDNPARQAFVAELVDKSLLTGAISINSTFVNVGRALGPAVAAALADTVGLAWCFFVDSASFAAVAVALLSLDGARLQPTTRISRARGQLRQGLAFARTTPAVVAPLVMMALIGTFAYELEVTLPLFADHALGSAGAYPWLIGAFGAGSVAGGVYCALRQRFGTRLIRSAVVSTLGLAATAFAPTVWSAVPLLFLVGIASIMFIITGNSTIQVNSPPDQRGRVVALWSTAFIGTTPIGAPIVGAIGTLDARAGLLIGALACAVAALCGSLVLRHG